MKQHKLLALIAASAAAAFAVAGEVKESGQFATLDADHDGRISATEAQHDAKTAGAFVAADSDQDGYLSESEFDAIKTPEGAASPDATTDGDSTDGK